MADNVNEDQAAIDAVANFFTPETEAAAAKEVGSGDAPVYSEAQQQADELEQEGISDPLIPDNTVVAKQPNDKRGESPAPAKATENAPAIDDDLRAIAKEHFGWTDAKIDRLIKADPELAVETFTSFAATLAEQARQYLPRDPGTTQPASQAQVEAATATTAKPQTSSIPAELSDDALKKFAEENGEASANLIRAVRDNFLARESALEQRLSRAESAATAQELKSVAAEATTVITGLSDKHPALYGAGSDINKLTVQQYNRRLELTSLADQIRVGAAAQGKKITVSDALKNAHYILSRDSVKSEARQEVAAKVAARSKQVVARPTARVNPSAPGQKKSDEAAQQAYAQRLAELGAD